MNEETKRNGEDSGELAGLNVSFPAGRRGGLRLLERWRRFFLPFVFLAVLLSASLTPKPVEAFVLTPGAIVKDIGQSILWLIDGIKRAAEAVAKLAKESGILSAFKAMQQAFNKGLTAIEKAWYDFGGVILGAKQGKVEAITRSAQAQADAFSTVARIKMSAETARDNPSAAKAGQGTSSSGSSTASGTANSQTPTMNDPDEILCFIVTARQMVPIMMQFRDLIANMLLRGYMAAGRGSGEDYDGPKYTAFIEKMRTGKLSTGGLAYGSPTEYSSGQGAADPSVLNKANMNFATSVDADISAETLEPGKAVLTVPAIQKRSVTLGGVSVDVVTPSVDTSDPKQLLWLAAVDFCSQAAGPRPTLHVDKALKTDRDRTATVDFSQGMAVQSGLVLPCALRVATLSRPNCADDKFKGFCEATQKGCKAAWAHGVILPSSFDNCEKGLSLYEAEYVSHILCASNGRQIANASGHKTAADMLGDTNLCTLGFAAWQSGQKKESQTFRASMKGLQGVRAMWAGVDR